MRFAVTFAVAAIIGCLVVAGASYIWNDYRTGFAYADWNNAVILGVVIGLIAAVRTHRG